MNVTLNDGTLITNATAQDIKELMDLGLIGYKPNLQFPFRQPPTIDDYNPWIGRSEPYDLKFKSSLGTIGDLLKNDKTEY